MLVKKKISLRPIEGLSGTFTSVGEDHFIDITWEPIVEDSLFLGYVLYASSPPDTALFREASLPLLTKNSYSFKVSYYYAQTYRFSVSALYRTGHESAKSDVLEITVPSVFLPNVLITNIIDTDQGITINWMYTQNIPDLEGFKIYINGSNYNEDHVPGHLRSYTLPREALPAGRTTVGISAITKSGIESRPSMVVLKR